MVSNLLLAVAVFSGLILLLALMLLYARRRLVPQGAVSIVINGDQEHPIKVQPGSSLLSSLADKNIFLPSACGGGGTCAMCECHADHGGGDVLPPELNHLSRTAVAEHTRLPCQDTVPEDETGSAHV